MIPVQRLRRDGCVQDLKLDIPHGLLAEGALARPPLEALGDGKRDMGVGVHGHTGRMRQSLAVRGTVPSRPSAPITQGSGMRHCDSTKPINGATKRTHLHHALADRVQERLVHFCGKRVVEEHVGPRDFRAKRPDRPCAAWCRGEGDDLRCYHPVSEHSIALNLSQTQFGSQITHVRPASPSRIWSGRIGRYPFLSSPWTRRRAQCPPPGLL